MPPDECVQRCINWEAWSVLTWHYCTAGARSHAFALTRAATLIELSPFQNKVIRLTGVARP
jgi:hypothetical protein